jgi:hypothetical protein
MTYTFWHSGILIGESDLEDGSDRPRQRGGVFRPTAYGLEVFPRLSGILAAGHALKTHLDANGLSPDDMDGQQIDELLEGTPAGQQIIDIGRTISEVEMRAPDGQRLEFESIAFSDLTELERLVRELKIGAVDDLPELPELPELPDDAPRYIVSATLRNRTQASAIGGRADPFRGRHWSYEN